MWPAHAGRWSTNKLERHAPVLNVGLAAGILDQMVFSMFVVMAVVLTIVTTPLTLWVYPAKYRSRYTSTTLVDGKDGAPGTFADPHRHNGPVAHSASDGDQTSSFMLIISRLEDLSTAMLFTQLFGLSGSTMNVVNKSRSGGGGGGASGPTQSKTDDMLKDNESSSEEGGHLDDHLQHVTSRATHATQLSSSHPPPLITQRWNAHRLIELTGRTHSVMQSIENETQARTDGLLQLYKSFAALRGITVQTGLDVVEQDAFPEIVTDRARDCEAELVVLPWTVPESGAPAAVINDQKQTLDVIHPMGTGGSRPATGRQSTFEHVFGTESSGLYTYFLRRVFAECRTNIAVVVDRGFAAPNNITMQGREGGQHVFVPFFGGSDDRLALQLVVQLCHKSNVTATVVRIEAATATVQPTNDEKSPRVPEQVFRKRKVSGISIGSMDESVKAHQTALDANHHFNTTVSLLYLCVHSNEPLPDTALLFRTPTAHFNGCQHDGISNRRSTRLGPRYI